MKARVSQLHKTEAEWNKLPNFIPLQGELIVFDSDKKHSYARLKIGDGIVQSDGSVAGTKLQDLPFIINSVVDECYPEIIDAGRVSDYKK